MAAKFLYPEQLKILKDRHKYFTIPSKEKMKRLTCAICKDLLVDPYQTKCGCRCCQICLSNNAISDKAVEREIFDLEIRCLNERCDHKCQLKRLSEHSKTCEFREKKCNKCEDLYPLKDRSEHNMFQCKMIMIKCDQCGSEMTKKDLERIHRNVEGNIDDVCYKWKGLCPLTCCDEWQNNMKVHLGVCPRVTVECPMKEIGCRKKLPRLDMNAHIERDPSLHAGRLNEGIVRLRKERHDFNCQLAEKKRKKTALIDGFKRSVEKISVKINNLTNRTLKPSLASQGTSRVSVPLLQNQFSFEWRIRDVFEKIKDAKKGNNVSILSNSFYTGRPGYKMCLKIYPNGLGSSWGTNLSLYFIIMRGEYDGDVAWPFSHKVSLTLKSNGRSSKDLTVNMSPDRNDNCYGRPKNNHNVAVGHPQFFSHSGLTEYVINGSIVIRITVFNPHSPRHSFSSN